MEIERSVLQKLVDWKNRSDRKPLILKGIRQIGKTWLLKHFGSRYFENVAYFNFEKQKDLGQFFSITKNPQRILDNRSLVNGKPVFLKRTLIIFDDIQECNEG